MKKKRFSKFNIFKSKKGLTYVELLTALALLSLIVVSFTPMMLSSYETIYEAGEKTEEIYESQKEIEGGLAARTSTNKYSVDMQLKLNGGNLMEQLSITGRRVVSSLNVGLETIFYGSKVRVDIVSPKLVYDNQPSHDVTLQITGIPVNKDKITTGAPPAVATQSDVDAFEKDRVHISVLFPDKATSASGDAYTNTDEEVYKTPTNITNVQTKTGDRVSFTISGGSGQVIDFTNSPLKVKIYYKNDRGLIRTVSDYLYIKPTQLLFAGKTNNYDYYTSAGVEEKSEFTDDTATSQSTEISMKFEGRYMTLDNSATFTQNADEPRKKGATINTIAWIENDPNPYLDGYYVMAGTNGSVYRMYNYARPGKKLNDVLAANLINTNQDGTTSTAFTPNYNSSTYSAANYNADNFKKGTVDLQYKMDNGAMALQSFWGGEISDQYYFRTGKTAMGYGKTADNKIDCTSWEMDQRRRASEYNMYDKTFRYIMNFSGFTTGYGYKTQNNRRISYILTEAGNKSSRTGGEKQKSGDYIGYTSQWEWGRWITENDKKCTDWEAVYFYNNSQNKGTQDKNLSYLRLKAYTSVDIFNLPLNDTGFVNDFNKGGFWSDRNDDVSVRDSAHWDYTENGETWITSKYANSPNVTDAVYLPGVGSAGQGQVMYFGYVPAYAYLAQRSDLDDDRSTAVYRNDDNGKSRVTDYIIGGSYYDGTTILRAYAHDTYNLAWVASNLMSAVYEQSISRDHDNKDGNSTFDFRATTTDNETYFYNNEDSIEDGDPMYRFVDSDLKFTFGYCSRWRTTIGKVTCDGTNEFATSYEYYYVKSSEGKTINTNSSSAGSRASDAVKPTFTQWPHGSDNLSSGLNKGNPDNIFYNVWFPGEFYNLTKVATCDEVTVAVGYTVSGSTFMKRSERANDYYGTALGDIYNDGVLAAYTTNTEQLNVSGKGDKSRVFQNLLYCKHNGYLDGNEHSQFADATLHSRKNMRFEAVGINAETPEITKETISQTKTYIAYYADNYGNVYKSKVAWSTVTPNKDDSNDEATGSETGVMLVSHIEDQQGFAKSTTGEKMIPVTIGTAKEPVSNYFSKVSTIECDEDVIVITGTPASGKQTGFVVGVKTATKDTSATDPSEYVWEWKFIPAISTRSEAIAKINDATMVSGYYYICGKAQSRGFVAGVSLDTLKDAAHNQGVMINPNGGLKNECMVICYPDDEIYAIAGRETN